MAGLADQLTAQIQRVADTNDSLVTIADKLDTDVKALEVGQPITQAQVDSLTTAADAFGAVRDHVAAIDAGTVQAPPAGP